MAVTEEAVLAALRTVQDPELFKDIVTLNMVKGVAIAGDAVTISVELTTPACPLKERIRAEVTAAVEKIPGVCSVSINLTANVRAGGGGKLPGLPGVKNIVAVGAGKGGVGKSTVAVNIAVGLALRGAKVGLLDGDIYGPSVPTLTGLAPQAPLVKGDKIIPFEIEVPMPAAPSPAVAGGGEGGRQVLKVMSIGFLVEPEKALIWRGPMAHGAIKQFLEQVEWGELDYLIVDLPPGTGDVSLTLAQTVPLTGAVIVATPQEVALMDARRAVRMFQQLGIEILGVVENMSYFVCEHGASYDIFGRGGAQTMAQTMGLPFLGEIPIDMQLRVRSDAGTPFDNFLSGSISAKHLESMIETLAGQITVRNVTRPSAKPLTMQVS
jgi:ATP-binding protein involved in chromosome partitioning